MKASPLFLLFLVFLTLKLCEVITWSWWWVTAPLWGFLVLLLVVFLAACMFYGVRERQSLKRTAKWKAR